VTEELQIIKSKSIGSTYTVQETVSLEVAAMTKLVEAGMSYEDAVTIIKGISNASWLRGWDSGYKTGADHHE
jgi:hypothetical protein